MKGHTLPSPSVITYDIKHRMGREAGEEEDD
jgi:hypothetical protein